MSPKAVRTILERLVTKQDYFRQPHMAEPNPRDPLCSYYYDLRGRAKYPGTLHKGLPVVSYGSLRFVNPVSAAQYGLAHLQHYWDTGQESYLALARQVAEALVRSGGEEKEGLVWRYPVPIKGSTDWLSALAQGQAASLLLRVGFLAGEGWYLSKARRVLHPFLRRISDGGVQTLLNGDVWFEEYSVSPPPYTLNGFVVALLSIRDAAFLLEEDTYSKLFEEGMDTLERRLALFNVNGWSRYDLTQVELGPLATANLASPFYHRFHIELLRILEHFAVGEVIETQRENWTESLDRGTVFYRALLEKSLYRLATPGAKPST